MLDLKEKPLALEKLIKKSLLGGTAIAEEMGVRVIGLAYALKDLLVMLLLCEITVAKQFQSLSMETPLSDRNEARFCCAEVPLLLTRIRKKRYIFSTVLFWARGSLINWSFPDFLRVSSQRGLQILVHD